MDKLTKLDNTDMLIENNICLHGCSLIFLQSEWKAECIPNFDLNKPYFTLVFTINSPCSSTGYMQSGKMTRFMHSLHNLLY